MKEKFDFRIAIIIILIIILIVMCYLYFKDSSKQNLSNMEFNSSKLTENTNNVILNITSEVTSSLSENIELHAPYYLEECYVKTNQSIKAGENILKYTNGTYLTSPYDCVITELNIPDEETKCTNEHYIGISSINSLQVQFKVDETKINSIALGQEARIKIEAYEDKVLQGYITNISSTANNGKFTVTVDFENDGEVLLGMTANVTI